MLLFEVDKSTMRAAAAPTVDQAFQVVLILGSAATQREVRLNAAVAGRSTNPRGGMTGSFT